MNAKIYLSAILLFFCFSCKQKAKVEEKPVQEMPVEIVTKEEAETEVDVDAKEEVKEDTKEDAKEEIEAKVEERAPLMSQYAAKDIIPQFKDTSVWRFCERITGHFNSDNRLDTAYLFFKYKEEEDYTIVYFTDHSLPSLKSNYTMLYGRMVNLGDLNRDGKDEIGFEPVTHGVFYSYHVWTLHSGKWIDAIEPFTSVEYFTDNGVEERPHDPPVKRHPKKKGYVLVYQRERLLEDDGSLRDTLIIKSVRAK